MADVVFKHVSKSYDDTLAVDDLSLEVRDKEFFVLLGESGAGKTTTLKLVAGVEPVTQGSIKINGQATHDLPPEKRNVAMVFESYALYSHLSVYDNIAFSLHAPGRKASTAQIDQAVRRVAETLGIDHLLRRRPSALSGGQRQRVALGRALVRQPAVFLMDEPLSHLDAKLRNQMRTELKNMRESFGTTILYVTHDYSEALALGDRIAILHEGRIQQVGTPSQVFHQPQNRLIAGALGDPPMNFLSGTLCSQADRLVIKTDHGDIPVGMPLKPTDNRSVCLGIRPQHIELTRKKPARGFSISTKVFVQELLGDDSIISVALGKILFMILSETEQTYAPDETVYISWQPKHMHLFNESGKNLRKEESSH